jgi:oligopeptidase B
MEWRYLKAEAPDSGFNVFLPREKGHRYYIDHREGLFYVRTNRGAVNFSVMTAPENDPSPKHWKQFIVPRKDVLLTELELFRDFAVSVETSDAVNRLRVYNFAKKSWTDIPFAETVYTAFPGSTPEYTSTTYRYSYQSFLTPQSVFDFDTRTGKSNLLKRQEVLGGYDPSQYSSERLWATARDGTKVPISIVYKKGFARDGKGALYLYGYGSYGIGTSATFSSSRLSLLDRGMAYAIAHIRGGDEMGWQWRLDGMLMKKKNTFFDFIDSAEYLVNEKWTAKDRLVIEGGSAGGLLMGAVVNLAPPGLFRAVHLAVPFVDVMNTMLDASLPLTVGEYLEWGNPNEKAAYDYMKTYSPYDNLTKHAYPAILVTTSFNDSQVMYWEPAKYVAKLRTVDAGDKPLLLKIKMEPAGHGGASGRYDRLHDQAFEYAWMMTQVGITK